MSPASLTSPVKAIGARLDGPQKRLTVAPAAGALDTKSVR